MNNASRFKTIASALVLSAVAATPVLAQAAVQEPGLQAFYHPGADILNAGALGSQGLRQVPNAYAAAGAADLGCAQRHRSYDAATNTFRGRDGRRMSCN